AAPCPSGRGSRSCAPNAASSARRSSVRGRPACVAAKHFGASSARSSPESARCPRSSCASRGSSPRSSRRRTTRTRARPARRGPLGAPLGGPSPELPGEAPVKAGRALAGAPREVDTLWLLPAGTSPGPELVGTGVRDVIVRDGPGIRLSRIPERATLGRSARARRIDELSAAIESEERALEEQVRERQALDAVLRDLDRALADPELLARGDPSAAIEAERRALEAAREEEARHREAAERAR